MNIIFEVNGGVGKNVIATYKKDSSNLKSIDNDLKKYESIIPCGIKNKGITNLKKIKNQNYDKLEDILIKNLILNLQN